MKKLYRDLKPGPGVEQRERERERERGVERRGGERKRSGEEREREREIKEGMERERGGREREEGVCVCVQGRVDCQGWRKRERSTLRIYVLQGCGDFLPVHCRNELCAHTICLFIFFIYSLI